MFDEILKLFFTGHAMDSFKQLRRTHYFELLFGATAAVINKDKSKRYLKLLEASFKSTDMRYSQDKPLNPAFLLAVFGWPVLQVRIERYQKGKYKRLFEALHHAIEEVIEEQVADLSIPRRFTAMIRAIWMLQYHMLNWRKSRAYRIVTHRYFRAAIDFLEMRAQIGKSVGQEAKWWRDFYNADKSGRERMLKQRQKK